MTGQAMDPPPVSTDTPGLALSLSSSFLGFYAHAGFLAGLVERGQRPQFLAGASAGALIAGLYAAGFEPEKIRDLIFQRDFRRSFLEFGRITRAPAAALGFAGHAGLLTGDGTLKILRSWLGDRRIEDCSRPLAVAVTNLATHQPELRTTGDLAAFLTASMTFPGIFRPRDIDGTPYWDGGIAHAMPVDHWHGDPRVTSVIAHEIGHPPKANPGPLTLYRGLSLVHEISSASLLELRVERLRTAGHTVTVIESLAPRPSPFAKDEALQACYEAGRRAC